MQDLYLSDKHSVIPFISKKTLMEKYGLEKSTMKEKLRCAVVGLGRIGTLLEEDVLREKPCTHAGAIHDNQDALLVGGCDIDEERRIAFSEKWNDAPVFDSVDELIQTVQPDILCVATPPETHLPIIESALYSSVGLIICEKPLATQSDQASRIARFHEEGAMKIMTNHERRYSEDYVSVQRSIFSERFLPGRFQIMNRNCHDGFLVKAPDDKIRFFGNQADAGAAVFLKDIFKSRTVIRIY